MRIIRKNLGHIKMDDFSKTLKGLSALAQETRLCVFRYLMKSGATGVQAGKIATDLDIAPNKLSAHLSILVAADLLDVRKDGRRMIYSANINATADLIKSLIETCCDNNPTLCKALNDVAAPVAEQKEPAVCG